MASKIKLNNNQGDTITLEHSNTISSLGSRVIPLDNITHKVNSIAEFRATSENPEYVHVTGYHTADDGAFGSHFFKRIVSTGQADNGGTLIINASNTLYELQYSGAVNARWFGAVGDYIDTTTTFTDNYTSIQNAINFCEENNISSLFIPDGKFLVSQGLVSRSSLRIFGTTKPYSGDWIFEGSKGSTLVAGTAVNTPVLSLINKIGMVSTDNRISGIVENLLIVGNHDSTGSPDDKGFLSGVSGPGIFIQNRQGTLLKTVTVIKCGGGFEAAGTDVLTVTENALIDCNAALNYGNGVFGGFTDSTITRGRFSFNTGAGIVVGSQDLRISGTYIDFNGTHGIAIRANGTVVDNCVINYNGQDGINHNGAIGARVVNSNIAHHDAGSGIEAFDTGSIIVANNVFDANAGGSLKKFTANSTVYWDDSNETLSGSELNIFDYTGLSVRREIDRVVGSTLVPAGSGASFSQVLVGVKVGDFVYVATPALPSNQIMVSGYVRLANTIELQMFNFSGASQDVAGTYKLSVRSII